MRKHTSDDAVVVYIWFIYIHHTHMRMLKVCIAQTNGKLRCAQLVCGLNNNYYHKKTNLGKSQSFKKYAHFYQAYTYTHARTYVHSNNIYTTNFVICNSLSL